MDVTTTKVVAMLILGGVSIFLGFLPRKIGRYFVTNDGTMWKRTITSALLCFGGGVLFATSFVHMLPEVREGLESAELDMDGIPVAEIMLCCGFFLIYLIEESVHYFLDSHVHEEEDQAIQLHRSFSIHSQACEAGLTDMQQRFLFPKSDPSPEPKICRRRAVSYPASQDFHHHHHHHQQPHHNTYNTFVEGQSESRITRGSYVNSHEEPSRSSAVHIIEASTDSSENTTNNTPSVNDHSQLMHTSSIRDFFTVLALSFHAIFEGLAVGLEDDARDVWTLFAAVATHKFVISFCVGLELFHANTRLLIYATYMLVFALVSPLGIGIGIIITSFSTNEQTYHIVVAVLQALAGGTIIYVVVFEVLQRERSKSVSGLAQLFFVMLGFSVMMCVEIFAGHHHEHLEETGSSTMEPVTAMYPDTLANSTV